MSPETNLQQRARAIYQETRSWEATHARLETMILDDDELLRKAAHVLAAETLRHMKTFIRETISGEMQALRRSALSPKKFDDEVMRRTSEAVDAFTYYSWPLSNGVMLGEAYAADVAQDQEVRKGHLESDVSRWLFDALILDAMKGSQGRVKEVLSQSRLAALDAEALRLAKARLKDPRVKAAGKGGAKKATTG